MRKAAGALPGAAKPAEPLPQIPALRRFERFGAYPGRIPHDEIEATAVPCEDVGKVDRVVKPGHFPRLAQGSEPLARASSQRPELAEAASIRRQQSAPLSEERGTSRCVEQ